MSASGGRASRLLVEGAVIVVSILLAFGIDAWWDERQLERDVVRELRSVGRELEVNLELLDFQMDLLARMSRGTEELSERLELEAGTERVAVPDTLLFYGVVSVTFDPSLGAIDALVASGRLSAISDEELRLALAGLRGQVQDATELQVVTRALYYEQLSPLLAEESDYAARGTAGVSQDFWLGERVAGRALRHSTDIAIPNSPRIRALIRERRVLDEITYVELQALQASMRELVRAIEAIG